MSNTALDLYQTTGQLPEDPAEQDQVMRELLAAPRRNGDDDDDEEQIGAAGGQDALELERRARADAEAHIQELTQKMEEQRALYDTLLERAMQVGQPGQAPEAPEAPKPHGIEELLSKLKEDEWEVSPQLMEVLEYTAKQNAALTEKIGLMEQYLTQQYQAAQAMEKAEAEKTQQDYQRAIDHNPQLAHWQREPESWGTVQELWNAVANTPKFAKLPLDEQMTKLAAMAESVLIAPNEGAAPPPAPSIPTAAAAPAQTGNVVPLGTRQAPNKAQAAPVIHSIGDVPGQALETAESRPIADMSTGEIAALVSKMDDRQFQAFISGRRF